MRNDSSRLSKVIYYPAPGRARVIVFGRFLFFLSLSATLRENGSTDLHEIFREGVEWPWDDLIKFWVNSVKRVGGSKVNLLSPAIAIWFDCGLLAVLCCHLATENVMKLLFLAFRYVAAGRGVCCAPHHSLFRYQSKARMRLPISDQSQPWSYLAPFRRRRFGDLNAENSNFFMPTFSGVDRIWCQGARN